MAISAGCNVFNPWFGAVTGAIAAVVYNAASIGVKFARIDDPCDAIAGIASSSYLDSFSITLLCYTSSVVPCI